MIEFWIFANFEGLTRQKLENRKWNSSAVSQKCTYFLFNSIDPFGNDIVLSISKADEFWIVRKLLKSSVVNKHIGYMNFRCPVIFEFGPQDFYKGTRCLIRTHMYDRMDIKTRHDTKSAWAAKLITISWDAIE